MRVLLRYFREHPWQRRALTLSLTALLGVAAAWVAWPILRDRQVLRLLGSDDPYERERAVTWALELAPRRPELLERLERRLDSAGEVEFATIAQVLNRLGRFNTPARPGAQIDRWRTVNLAAATGRPEALPLRLLLLNGLVRDGRDNAHVRRGLRLAAEDVEAEVRAASAVLAARLGDDGTLTRLLDDAEPQVRAAAAIDAALAGRKGCAAKIAEIFNKPKTDEDLAAAAYALARLAPDEYGKDVAERLEQAFEDGNADLLDRLLHAAALVGQAKAGGAVLKVVGRAHGRNEFPPAMAFVAAGRMKLTQAGDDVQFAIRESLRRGTGLTFSEVESLAAAINAARRLKLPVGGNVAAVMARLWHEKTSLAMMLAAELLGEQEPIAGGGASPEAGASGAASLPAEGRPPGQHLADVLRQAADHPGTPVPSAAAAVALFRLAPDQAEEGLRTACASENWLAGDYLAWHLARPGRHEDAAWRIAAALFGPGEYNDAVRSAGAVLLAMLARGTDHAGDAARAIEARLDMPGQDPFVAGSYRCALLILGRREFAGEVTGLARSVEFPKRRALTALVLAGEPAGFDIVFGSERLDPAGMDSLLAGRLMARVYAAVAADMPAFDVEAPARVRHWQCGICRDFYLIHRRAILDRMRQ